MSLQSIKNGLHAWSINTVDAYLIKENIESMGYFSEKIPISISDIKENRKNNRFKEMIIDELITKMENIKQECLTFLRNYKTLRIYFVITEPDYFGSEVGVMASKIQWQNMTRRSINEENYKEEISKDIEYKYVNKENIPHDIIVERYNHIINDNIDNIHFNGIFLLFYFDIP